MTAPGIPAEQIAYMKELLHELPPDPNDDFVDNQKVNVIAGDPSQGTWRFDEHVDNSKWDFYMKYGYFNYDYYDDVVLGRVKTSDITGKRVLIQYLPATDSDRQQFERVNGNWKELSSDSINVKPTLTVDGEIIGQGYAVPLGTVQSLSTNLRYDGQNNNNS